MVDSVKIGRINTLLSSPELVGQDDVSLLKSFSERYPYFQPLRLLLAKAALGTEDEKAALTSAALYTNGQLLHNFLHEPEYLLNTKFNYAGVIDDAEPEAIDGAAIDEVTAEITALAEDEQETFEEIVEVDISDYPQASSSIGEATDDEVFEEITEFHSEVFASEINPPIEDNEPDISDEEKTPEADEGNKLEHNLVLENIVSTDFFAFQDNFKVESIPEIEDQESAEADALEDRFIGDDDNVVSKYDDDKLPYTFLWWLAKTRKEYQQIFQPYASPRKVRDNEQRANEQIRPAELQHQYVEHIFHLQTPFNAEELVAAPVHPKVPHKGSEIIEQFIKNEPQIRVPKAAQINNENKARKSAEDHNEMVTETLAKIYIEQMLYEKAIETYHKLSLKFPEKSRYFADLVRSIEKKI